jgi:hypothetical protein
MAIGKKPSKRFTAERPLFFQKRKMKKDIITTMVEKIFQAKSLLRILLT